MKSKGVESKVTFFDDFEDRIRMIRMTVNETKDQFIFSTIKDWAEDNFDIVIEKEELVYAIQLIRRLRAMGIDCNDYYDAYTLGYEAGVEHEHRRVADILQEV